MDYFAAAFALLLGDASLPNDPHPERTLFRGVVVRTLDDAPLRLSLGLTRERSENLVRFLQEMDRRQEEFCTARSNPGERAAVLRREAARRTQTFFDDLKRALGEDAAETLTAAALRQWGPAAAFATGPAKYLDVTAEQRRKAEKVVEEYIERRDRIVVDPQNPPPAAELSKLAAGARKALVGLLTARQLELREKLERSAPQRPLQLYVESEANREERESRPPVLAIHRPKERLLRLVQIDDVLDLLKLPADKRAALVAFRKRAGKEESDLASLKRTDSDTQRERSAKLAEFDGRVEAELGDLLGLEPMNRLREIRWQLAGVGAVFGVEASAALGVTPEQAQAALAKSHEIANRNAERLQGADPAKFARIARTQQRELEDAMLSVLSAEQRAAWKKLQGEPIRAETLARIAKRL